MLQFVFLVAGRAVPDQRTGVLQGEIEQKYRTANMVSGLDRVVGSRFRKWHNIVHNRNSKCNLSEG